MGKSKKPVGVYIIGLSVFISNLLILVSLYFNLKTGQDLIPSRIFNFISMTAVFPQDFYYRYLGEQWVSRLSWLLVMIWCSWGVLLLKRAARAVFIVLNIIHIVILTYIVILQYGNPGFLDYFFRLYFNAVASGAFVAFLTIPEARDQFKISRLEGLEEKLQLLFKKRFQDYKGEDAHKYSNLGLAYSRLAQYDEAIDALKKAVKANPEHAGFHFSLGMTYMKQKDFGEAVKAFQKVVTIDPIHLEAYYHLGLAYQEQGCDDEAIESFIKVTHIRPHYAAVYRPLGELFMSRGRFQEAVDAFQKAIVLNPKDEFSCVYLGEIFLNETGNFKTAQEILKRAIRINPQFFDAHFYLGLTSMKLNRYKDAVRHFKEAVRLRDGHLQSHYQLGVSYALLKDFDSARREYRYLEECDKDLAENLNLLIKQI